MEKNKYVIQFNEDFNKIYEKEHSHLIWCEDICKVIMSTTPTRNGDDYVYEFESEHRLGCTLTFMTNKITINGKVIKNRYGQTDYVLSNDEWAKILEHGKRNIECFNEINKVGGLCKK